MYGIPRGILNNNPLNIRKSGAGWVGKIIPSHDKEFEQFDKVVDGIRAGAKLLSNYYRLHQLSTVTQIISRFAPANENKTAAYISNVCKHMGVAADDHMDLNEPEIMAALVKAVIEHENGEQPYSDAEINEAVGLVLTPVA